ncbi:MAG: flagellar biosynthesis regulator FlaF [Pseudorhodoplanes sp.]|nr:MAG: flagellar biosynthesis regulator FlaF [Pseudorhodoplanes sp.]
MQNAAKAYGAVANQTASPRDLEANLLLKAASRLQAIHDDWESGRASLDSALTFNRKLWTVFLSSVTDRDNPLPSEVRQNVANIGLFVLSQTVSMSADPRREQLPSLININRELAAGLRSA